METPNVSQLGSRPKLNAATSTWIPLASFSHLRQHLPGLSLGSQPNFRSPLDKLAILCLAGVFLHRDRIVARAHMGLAADACDGLSIKYREKSTELEFKTILAAL